MSTGFYYDERTFWFGGGNYALTVPVGGLMQPLVAGGLPEGPETKRRLVNLMNATGLIGDVTTRSATEATRDDLLRVHPESYLTRFKEMSDAGGGEIGLRAPFGSGGYEQAALSTGLSKQALADVMAGTVQQAYALSRPPGHHCLPDFPNGFCLLANIAIALQAARQDAPLRAVILDWDVHHGNGTEAIYLDDPDTLTISIHQEHNYPMDTGDADVTGVNHSNINIPLPPGAGHVTYLQAMDRIVRPAIDRFKPDIIIVACGFDAAAVDPLSRMLATADTFRQMTLRIQDVARAHCDGRLLLVHEGGYSEVYVPFCGHATIEALLGIGDGHPHHAPDPLAQTFALRQPSEKFEAFLSDWVDDLARFHRT
ncbi:class II histone deacetylase [Shimia ponticola]|uniref:class II histone deacetylase n=1 Tax=Shimia ponticola TaxID=2582893 RepID=UPI0011BD77F1|nr:class II histone deacetylase [Shimia ponticola]